MLYFLDTTAEASERVIDTPSMRAKTSGADVTKSKWIEVSDLVKEKKLFTVFDSPYQGSATGDFRQISGPSRTHLSGYSPSDSKFP
jgi:aspartate/tyrosine/aromatic aminotransferase